MTDQLDMFGSAPVEPSAPEGFRYAPDLLPLDMEATLLASIPTLPFHNFEFGAFEGKRRVVSFGHRYDFSDSTLKSAEEMPDFLLPVRDLAATFADLDPAALEHVLVTEYAPGAGIGWHRDKAVFGDVIGISLLSVCRFRLRRRSGTGWERYNLDVEPRSAYLLRGPSRTVWEHSIPPGEALRYSITFRSMAERKGQR